MVEEWLLLKVLGLSPPLMGDQKSKMGKMLSECITCIENRSIYGDGAQICYCFGTFDSVFVYIYQYFGRVCGTWWLKSDKNFFYNLCILFITY